MLETEAEMGRLEQWGVSVWGSKGEEKETEGDETQTPTGAGGGEGGAPIAHAPSSPQPGAGEEILEGSGEPAGGSDGKGIHSEDGEK